MSLSYSPSLLIALAPGLGLADAWPVVQSYSEWPGAASAIETIISGGPVSVTMHVKEERCQKNETDGKCLVCTLGWGGCVEPEPIIREMTK